MLLAMSHIIRRDSVDMYALFLVVRSLDADCGTALIELLRALAYQCTDM